ncbi:hypothetical protein [Ralstonia phage RP31]|uniref:Uncharacterized protein n=2 Tax=Ripduovirus RP12 TaxID=2560700 RepID=A0A1L7N0U7_9CAUD|nr:hypothetical protein FDH28_gp111 [Ralstonia phage RP12]BAW19085.1 hypothetical protein [Ralstonia phage RP12]BAW19371.1 hypothetical protein [Ralstonia phage RP31]
MSQVFKCADDFSRDHQAAVIYLHQRPENNTDGERIIEKFMKTLKWEYRTEDTLMADVYGCKIVIELRPCALHAFPIWGELFYGPTREADPELFDSLECFVAFCVARWW